MLTTLSRLLALSTLILLFGCFRWNGSGQTRGPVLTRQQARQGVLRSGTDPAREQAFQRELERLQPQVMDAAIRSVTNQPGVEQKLEEIAHQIQIALQLQIDFPDALAGVQRAVAYLSQSKQLQQIGRANRQQAYGQARLARMLTQRPGEQLPPLSPDQAPGQLSRVLFEPTPEVAGALERENQAIEHAAALRNERATEELGEREAKAITQRIHTKLGGSVRADVLHIQVMMAVSRVQMLKTFGPDGPVRGYLKREAVRANAPLRQVIESLGTVDLTPLPELVRKGYQGQPDEVVRLLRAELQRTEKVLLIEPWKHGEDAEKMTQGMQFTVDTVLSLAQQNPDHAELARLAYDTVLFYRSHNAEVERRVSAALAELHSSEAHQVQRRLLEVRRRIAAVELERASGATPSEAEEQALQKARQEERTIAQQADQLASLGRFQDRPFQLQSGFAQIRAGLGPDQAVVSFVEYRHTSPATMNDPSQWPRWYGGFVLTRDALVWKSLGPASSVEPAVDELLAVLTDRRAPQQQKQQAAHTLFELSFAPLLGGLDAARELRIVADAAMQLVPIEVLHDGRAWLAERFRISYVVSERQLSGEYEPRIAAGPARIVVGGPYSDHPRPLRPGELLSAEHFPRLPSLDVEARDVQAALAGASLVSGARANEAALDVPAPRVLHIAAHGVYLPLNGRNGPDDRGLVLTKSEPAPPAPLRYRPPIDDATAQTRSVLVLSPAANARSEGFVTAYEISARNLWGTQLVVLSACESGRGLPDRVRGVRGLRSAFFTAGAGSLLLSMWSIDDRVTAEFMRAFYEQLARGVGRAQASAAASALIRERHPDPYLWAPFILLGDTGPLTSGSEPVTVPAGEDEESRLRRAFEAKRRQHTMTAMGTGEWTVGAQADRALDAYVKLGPGESTLTMTLLGSHSSISLLIGDYKGAGSYRVARSLRASLQAVSNPLALDISQLHSAGRQIEADSGELQIAVDTVKDGFEGSFSLSLHDGRSLVGKFKLASGRTAPIVPE